MEYVDQLLQQSAQEIKSLRKQNELMTARLDMFDDMMMLFSTIPAQSGRTMSPDIVYEIEKHLEAKKQTQ